MAFSAVQVTGATSDVTSVTKAFGSNVALGNLIIVVGMKFTPTTDDFIAADCTQSAGTATLSAFTLDKVINRTNGTNFVVTGIWSATVTVAGPCTITVGGGVASSQHDVGIGEFHSDVATSFALESSNTGNGASGNAATGNATTAGGGLFIGGVATFTSVATTHTPGAGYTQIYEEEDGSVHATGNAEYQIVSVGTTTTASWTVGTNTGWAAAVAAYKEVITASGSVSNMVPMPFYNTIYIQE